MGDVGGDVGERLIALVVMPGLVPGIHAFVSVNRAKRESNPILTMRNPAPWVEVTYPHETTHKGKL